MNSKQRVNLIGQLDIFVSVKQLVQTGVCVLNKTKRGVNNVINGVAQAAKDDFRNKRTLDLSAYS